MASRSLNFHSIWISQNFNTEILLFHSAGLQQKAFSIGLGTALDFITSYPTLSCDESRKEEDEEIKEVTANLPATKQISMDAAIAVSLSGLDAIFDGKK